MKHNNLLQTIGNSLASMRKSERKVGEYVLSHPNEVIHMRIVDLAQEASVSEPTVVRFCRAAGCDGFQNFKLSLARHAFRSLRQDTMIHQYMPDAPVNG